MLEASDCEGEWRCVRRGRSSIAASGNLKLKKRANERPRNFYEPLADPGDSDMEIYDSEPDNSDAGRDEMKAIPEGVERRAPPPEKKNKREKTT